MVEQALTLANIEDSTDCTKRLICELKRKPDPMWDERLIQKAVSDRVSFASPAVQFELAAEIGNKEGPKQCVVAFRRWVWSPRINPPHHRILDKCHIDLDLKNGHLNAIFEVEFNVAFLLVT